jgi:16S rRNA (cytidine1402-2'-O)-methyltransferase
MKKKGTLYVVSTPIGNMEDITLRALRILKEVHLIAAEDTRRTRKLLNVYDINCPLTSLHDQNELKKSASIISRLNDGMDVAYVSDAGTPGISDPGYILINQAIDHAINVVPIPGPSAVVAALSASGLPMDSFAFLGFLPSRAGKRKQQLESLRDEKKTMVFYESPRRILATLKEIEKILGNRNAVIVRELTKVYEEILRGNLRELINTLQKRDIKGEITLLISGAEKHPEPYSREKLTTRYNELHTDPNLSTRDIVNIISEEMGMQRKEVYKEVLQYLKEFENKDL